MIKVLIMSLIFVLHFNIQFTFFFFFFFKKNIKYSLKKKKKSIYTIKKEKHFQK